VSGESGESVRGACSPISSFIRRENDITDVIDDTFCTTEERFGEIVTVDLKPGGRDVQVTEDNKKEYVEWVTFDWDHRRLETDAALSSHSLVTTYRIEKRVSEQFEAFMSGFNELIPQELINVFDERELEVSRAIVLNAGAPRHSCADTPPFPCSAVDRRNV